jgi:hypothetical protein
MALLDLVPCRQLKLKTPRYDQASANPADMQHRSIAFRARHAENRD